VVAKVAMTVYAITNDVNDKVYVGACVRPLKRRWTNHVSDARKGRGTNSLHADMMKYGIEKFFYTAIWTGIITFEKLKLLERYYIRCFRTLEPNGYNRTEGGDSISEEARECLDQTGAEPWNKGMRGIALSTSQKMRAAKVGRILPMETRTKMRISQQMRRAKEAENS
jgi:group I intron endonuclease